MRRLLARAVVLAGLATPWTAAALPLRSPQVAFNAAPLQNYLNGAEGGIQVLTDQLADVTWWPIQLPSTPYFDLFLTRNLGPNASAGVYAPNAPDPTLIEVFPPGAPAGSSAALSFIQGNLNVDTFDANGDYLGITVHPGVSRNNFGFYTRSQCGTWFAQASLNPLSSPQALTYASTITSDSYWVCFELCPYSGVSTFDGVVLLFRANHGDPAVPETWGRVKGMYR